MVPTLRAKYFPPSPPAHRARDFVIHTRSRDCKGAVCDALRASIQALAGLLALLLLLIALSSPCRADDFQFIFQLDPGEDGLALPSGVFGWDPVAGLFSNFQVDLNGVTTDLTDAANSQGGYSRLPFERGILISDLITGLPFAGGTAGWWANDTGFLGFEWRTPAQDFLFWDLDPAGNPDSAIYNAPNAYSGTWTTQPLPEPGAFTLAILGAALLAFLRWRRRCLPVLSPSGV